jgi:phage/plasmid primase-like uncharacterized protein
MSYPPGMGMMIRHQLAMIDRNDAREEAEAEARREGFQNLCRMQGQEVLEQQELAEAQAESEAYRAEQAQLQEQAELLARNEDQRQLLLASGHTWRTVAEVLGAASVSP